MEKIQNVRKVLGFVGLGLAAIASVLGVIGIISLLKGSDEKIACLFFGLVGAILSYLLAGGIGEAFKSAWGFARTMWCLIPAFPLDLLLGAVGMFFALLVFAEVPFVFVLRSVRAKFGQANE